MEADAISHGRVGRGVPRAKWRKSAVLGRLQHGQLRLSSTVPVFSQSATEKQMRTLSQVLHKHWGIHFWLRGVLRPSKRGTVATYCFIIIPVRSENKKENPTDQDPERNTTMAWCGWRPTCWRWIHNVFRDCIEGQCASPAWTRNHSCCHPRFRRAHVTTKVTMLQRHYPRHDTRDPFDKTNFLLFFLLATSCLTVALPRSIIACCPQQCTLTFEVSSRADAGPRSDHRRTSAKTTKSLLARREGPKGTCDRSAATQVQQ